MALTIALSSLLAVGGGSGARADAFHVVPKVVPAIDVNTGGPYLAPPVPYGCYAKDHLGALHGALGGLCCGLCGGKGCGHCGGKGCGLFGHGGGKGCGHGDPCGGKGCGLFGRGGGCGLCGGRGCGSCLGLAQGGHGAPCGGKGCGLFGRGHGHGRGSRTVCVQEAGIAGPIQATSQAPQPSAQSLCGSPGCHIKAKHRHRSRLGRGCGSCGGAGCGACGGGGLLAGRGLCGSCGGAGCGLCGGRGGFIGDPCSNCGGKGCGLCGHGRGHGCNACGGKGCGLCKGGHSLLPRAHSLVRKVFHIGDVKYFVGPGGPVPITPGYVPYVVTTRSPRDFLAFPPFADVDP